MARERPSALLAEIGDAEAGRRLVFALFAEGGENQHEDRHDIHEPNSFARRTAASTAEVTVCRRPSSSNRT